MNMRHRLASWLLRGMHPRDPALADVWGGPNTEAGVTVTQQTAMSVAAFYACMRVLSESVASLPLVLYKRQKRGGRERATEHPLYRVLHDRPNDMQSSFGFREQGMMNMCLRGVSYSEIVGDKRGRRILKYLNPDRTRAFESERDGTLNFEHTDKKGVRRILLAKEVLRVPFATIDGIDPITPIAAMKESLGYALASQNYGSRFWQNDARPTGGWIEFDGAFRDDDRRKKVAEDWLKAVGGANKHKTPILPTGMQYHPLQMTMADSQFLEARKFSRAEIAGWMRVPPHMIGDLERATFSNIEQQAIDFVTHGLLPWLRRWEQAIASSLLDEAEQEDYYAEFNVDGLLRGDSTARANYYQKAIQGGWMSRNEARTLENLNEAEGLDEYLVPVNLAPASKHAEILLKPDAAANAAPGSDDDDPEGEGKKPEPKPKGAK